MGHDFTNQKARCDCCNPSDHHVQSPSNPNKGKGMLFWLKPLLVGQALHDAPIMAAKETNLQVNGLFLHQ